MRLHAMMAVAAGLLIAADAPKDPSGRSDLDSLQGTWTLISAVQDGKPLGEDEVKGTRIVFAGDRFRFPREAEDATSRRGTFKIDPTKRPRRMDATTPAGEVSLGIYEVEGDDYRVCFAPPGEERPRAFGSEPGSGYIDQVWKRASETATSDADRFQGRWTMILGEREGRTLSDEEVASAGLTIAGNKYSYTLGGRAESGTFTLDLSRTPKGIDVTPEGGKPMLGIYQIDGDTHKVCLAEPGRERPTEFTTQPESGRSLYVMRRAKPAAQAPK